MNSHWVSSLSTSIGDWDLGLGIWYWEFELEFGIEDWDWRLGNGGLRLAIEILDWELACTFEFRSEMTDQDWGLKWGSELKLLVA